MHKKQNNKESKSYVQGLRPFGNTLPRGIRGILKKNGYNYSEIISKWKFLVGEEISSFAYPKSIKMVNGNENGLLLLAVERGNEITVEYSKKEIIDKINSHFGYALIKDVKLETFNSKRKYYLKKNSSNKTFKNFENKINKINNEDIRKSLLQFLSFYNK